MKPVVLFISPHPFFQSHRSPIRIRFNLLALAELGYSVHFLTLPIGEDLEIEGVRIIRIANPFNANNLPFGLSLSKLVFDLLFFKAVQLCWKTKYTVIHGIDEAGIFAALLARLFRTKSIIEKHSGLFIKPMVGA